jgi:hypothetical protein
MPASCAARGASLGTRAIGRQPRYFRRWTIQAPGEALSVPGLGDYTIGANSGVLLRPPTIFDASDIDNFNV